MKPEVRLLVHPFVPSPLSLKSTDRNDVYRFGYWCLLADNNLPLASSSWLTNQSGIVYVGSEEKIQSAVVNLVGAIGIQAVSATLELTTMRARLQKPGGETVTESIVASYRCLVDTYNSTYMRFRNSQSTAPYVLLLLTCFLHPINVTRCTDGICLPSISP
jgi:hypothetical protein